MPLCTTRNLPYIDFTNSAGPKTLNFVFKDIPEGQFFKKIKEMPRHSKNNTALSFFTYAEGKALDYGTKKVILNISPSFFFVI